MTLLRNLSVSESELSRMTPEQAAAALAKLRELTITEARDHLIPYVCATFPNYRPGKHHWEIAERLEAVERGEIKRLMVFAPPRHGKSELISARFPLWYLGRNPRHEVIAASYGGSLANEFGRRLRNLTQLPAHREVFPHAVLSNDSQARDHWVLPTGGVYIAAGIGGAVTGYGANLLIIDDPVKSHEDAESETMREKTWNWYTHDAYTRLMDPEAIVVVQTRWHSDDLSGRLLEEMKTEGDQWEILHLPAIDDDGQPLWPEKYGVDILERRRRAVGPRAWQSLFQGDPTPDEGTYFKREWVRYYDKHDLWRDTNRLDAEGNLVQRRLEMKTYGASDYAVTEGDGDYTVHVVVGVTEDDDIYVLDLWRKQTAPDEWIDAFLDLMEKHQTLAWGEEQGQIVKSLAPYILKRMKERKIYGARVPYPSAADKAIRARSFQARMASGHVYFPRWEPWTEPLVSELLKFPLGKHDDQVDALSIIGRMLAGMRAGDVPIDMNPERVATITTGTGPKLPPGYRPLNYNDLTGHLWD